MHEQGQETEPATPLEEMVAKAFADALGRTGIKVTDNFFVLGGNSLQATQVFVRLEKELEMQLPLQAMFRRPTIRAISIAILVQMASSATEETS